MKLVFYSIILNHHQACLADAFYKILGDDYAFVELKESYQNKGSLEDFSKRPYLIRAWLSADNYDKSIELAKVSEVCVFSGYESLPFQKVRMDLELLSFDMSERWLKKGWVNLLSPRIIKMFWVYHRGRWSRKPIYKLCCSAFTKRDMNLLGMYKQKCYKWGYFTNVDKSFDFSLSKQEMPSSKNISLMWCARFLDWKHPELPIHLAAKLMSKGYRFTLDMYGEGGKLENMKKLAKDLSVEHLVFFKGNVPNDQILEAMRSHDIFLFTSDKQEGWGAVANEAMSNGCCLVGSNEIGSIPFLLTNKENGLIFQSCDIESLTDNVMYLMDHPEELRRLAEAGVRTMQNIWSPEYAAKSLSELINCLQKGQKIAFKQGPIYMPKLLQLNVTSNWGSTGRIAEECNQIARSQGWDTYVAYGRDFNPSQSEMYCIESRWEVYEHYLEHRLLDNEGLASRHATKSFVRKIQELHPDIVHLHNIHDHWLNFEILFKFLNQTDIKVVYTFHDFWAMTGGCTHFVSSNCLYWQTGCHDCPQKRNLIDRSKRNYELKRKYIGGCNNLVITAVSEWVGSHVKLSFFKEKEIHVIPNGVDTQIFQPLDPSGLLKTMNLSDHFKNKFVILGVSSQWKSASKGLDDYIAMSRMLQPDEIIVLVGVPDKIIAKLPKNMIGIQRTNSQGDLAALYSRADVVTSFSSAETFGLTIVEGYACGTPAVVYDNTAPPSLITTETGLVARDHDYKDAYIKIQKIKQKGKSYYADACIQLAREKYDKKKCFSQYFQLYNQIING